MNKSKLVLVLLPFLAGNPVFAKSPTFKKLLCSNVIGSNLLVTADSARVDLVLRDESGAVLIKGSFHPASCIFGVGFSIDLSCDSPDLSVHISRAQKASAGGAVYSDVSVRMATQTSGFEHRETFSTRKVDYGKVGSCRIDDGFEVY
jgi:hypothetical protein